MAKLYIQMDDKEGAKEELAFAKVTMAEISELETRAMEMDTTLPKFAGNVKSNSENSSKNDGETNDNEQES